MLLTPDGDSLAYAASTPAKGSVTMTAPGQFTYTPTYAARHAAVASNATAADRQDTFTVTVSDGHGGQVTVPVTVSVIASPAVLGTIPVGAAPGAVVFTSDGSRAYVVNTSAGTVSVINTATNTVTGTITVGSGASAAAVSADGSPLVCHPQRTQHRLRHQHHHQRHHRHHQRRRAAQQLWRSTPTAPGCMSPTKTPTPSR